MYVPTHQELGNHPKLRRLARTLAISRPTAVGHLLYLWWWSQDYAPDGDLSYDRYTAEDIADAAMWEGEAYAFVDALKSAGFLDDLDGRLIIHDWNEYGGKVVLDRVKDAERKRAGRKQDVARTSGARPEDVQRMSDGVPTVDKIRKEKTRKEEKRENAPARVADEPPPLEGEVVVSVIPITEDRPYGMVAMLCEENEREVGAMPEPWRKQQLAIAKRLLPNYSIAQVRSYIRYRKTAWNGTEPFDLRHVEKDIGAWEVSGSPSRASPKRNGKSEANAEAFRQHAEWVRREQEMSGGVSDVSARNGNPDGRLSDTARGGQSRGLLGPGEDIRRW